MPIRLWISSILCLFCIIIFCNTSALTADNVTNGAISGATSCPGGTSLTRDITVPGAHIITDLDVGFLATHSWRGDIRLDLTSPQGTTVRLINSNTGGGGNIDNYNVRLDDGAADLINTGAHTTADGTIAPPFENIVRPNNALAAFNGQDAQGDWILTICDDFPGADNGNFVRASLFFDLTPTPPPALPCPAAQQINFDWAAPGSTNGWTAGTLTNSYTATTIPLTLTYSGDTGNLIPRNGVNTPVSDDEFSDVSGPVYGLVTYANFASAAQSMTLTINLGTAGTGVGGARFSVLDIDRNGWVDRVAVTGSLGGTFVTPVLTSGEFAMVDGNALVGTAQAATGQTQGNGTFSFSSPIDTITLIYDNHPSVGVNPDPQIMSLVTGLSLCPVLSADLSAVKTVDIFDPDNAGLYMTPGNEVLYKITVNNSAAATAMAENIDLNDVLPDNVRFLSATTTGFSGGAFGTPDLPPANTDCVGGACVIHFSGASLPVDSSAEIEVRALIK